MKYNELRIGNYCYNLASGSLEDCMIRGITMIDAQYQSETREGNCIIKNLEPIPITEEWLINFGFSETLKDAFRFETFDIKLLHFHNERSCFFITSMCLWDVEIHVRYVHQLQNIFYTLTGKELTHQKIN